MIPHQLQIKNFLSYGTTLQTINFDPYHLIYLSGKNGHGKSALLEALTWVIWGAGRKTLTSVKPDQGLIRLGQTHMIVIAEFSSNNHRYKIRREVTLQRNKIVLNLEFGLYDKNHNRWTPLTEKTTKDTQNKIESIIGLSYESFINSAFLKQGNANEFSKKSARERKEVFSEILGLGLYETIRTKAFQKIKSEQNNLAAIVTMKTKIDEILIQKKDTYILFLKAEDDRSHVQKKLIECTHYYHELEKKYTKVNVQWLHAQEQIQYCKGLKTNLMMIIDEMKKNYHPIRKEKKELLNKAIVLSFKQTELRVKIEEQEKFFTQRLELEQKIVDLEKIINQEIAQKNHAINELNQLNNALQSLILQKKNITQLLNQIPSEEQLKTFDDLYFHNEHKKRFLEKCLENRKIIYQNLLVKRNTLILFIEEIKDKINLISKQEDQDPACPLCNQNLSMNRKKFLQNSLEKDQVLTEKKLEKIKLLIPYCKEKTIALHNQVVRLEKQSAEYAHQKKIFEDQLGKAHALIQELTIIQQKETQLEKIVFENTNTLYIQWESAESNYYQTIISKDQYKGLLDSIIYDRNNHIEIKKSLTDTDELVLDLQKQLQEVIKKQKALLEKFTQMRTIKQEIVDIEQSYDNNLEKQLHILQKEKDSLKIILTRLEEEKDVHNNYFFELKTRLEHYKTLEAEYTRLIDEEKSTTDTITDYQIIAHAVSKDGLQALLIEEAIPDIEVDANALLAKLTNNQTQLFIESLKDLKSGGTKETLDIKISDNMGIRPYEMFSGGEAFRIDLALRIAISKLLAKRAGTALQTLIIDEGFGSQDEEGLMAIMDAMYKIQNDFEKIIVVSHLPAMKDQFPVHFVVEKKPHGSEISVKELC